jgi:ketopantoate reductase
MIRDRQLPLISGNKMERYHRRMPVSFTKEVVTEAMREVVAVALVRGVKLEEDLVDKLSSLSIPPHRT